jgi:hypothetical protein
MGHSCGPTVKFSLDHPFRVDFLGFHGNAWLFIIDCDEQLIIVVVVLVFIFDFMFIIIAAGLVACLYIHSYGGNNVVFRVGVEDYNCFCR